MKLDDDRFARWIYDTCRLFGASPATSSEVQAIVMRSLKEHRSDRDAAAAVRAALDASGEVQA